MPQPACLAGCSAASPESEIAVSQGLLLDRGASMQKGENARIEKGRSSVYTCLTWGVWVVEL